MFVNLGHNWANSGAPKVVTAKCLTTGLFGLGGRNNITISKPKRECHNIKLNSLDRSTDITTVDKYVNAQRTNHQYQSPYYAEVQKLIY